MNDNILRIRLPTTLATHLKQKANEFGRTASDVAREPLIINLRRMDAHGGAANAINEPPRLSIPVPLMAPHSIST